LTQGREREYLAWFYDEYSERAGAVPPEALDEFARAYEIDGAMQNGFEYYRSAPADADWTSDWLKRNGPLALPVLGVSGGAGRGRGAETAASLERVASDVECHVLPASGHLVPEEAPEELVALLRQFWRRVGANAAENMTRITDVRRARA
ncbi:MAG: hypothetical protein AAF967_14075, partial [Pseudomonadota bacterium]